MLKRILKLIEEWLGSLSDEGLAISREEILSAPALNLYPPSEVWLVEAIVYPALRSLQVTCRISAPHYLTDPAGMEHVSAEQLVRCYSQACFLLGFALLKEGNLGVVLPQEAMEDIPPSFLYAGMDVRYKRPEPTGHPISFTLTLDKTYQVGQNTVFYFTVASGSLKGKITCFASPKGSQQALDPNLYDWLYGIWKACWAELPAYKLTLFRFLSKIIKTSRRRAPQIVLVPVRVR